MSFCRIFLLLALLLPSSSLWAEPTIVILGDSLTEGYGVETSLAFPARLEKTLRQKGRPDLKVINAGISGSTSASGLSRLRWYLRSKPDIVLLALGSNDGLRGVAVSETQKNLRAIIDLAKRSGVRVLLAGLKVPPNYGKDYASQFSQLFRTLSKEEGVPLIPFLLAGVAGEADFNLPDGIHPNAQGHQKIADLVLGYLEPLLKKKK